MDELWLCDLQGLVSSSAWVVMPDHVHWLFELRALDLGRVVGAFKSRSARALNRVRADSGPVWQAGFHDHQIRDEGSLHRLAQYLLDNPRRRGLATAIADYPYWWCRGFDLAEEAPAESSIPG